MFAPWFLISAEAPTSATCRSCNNLPFATPFSLAAVTSYSQGWGLSLIITPSYAWFHQL